MEDTLLYIGSGILFFLFLCGAGLFYLTVGMVKQTRRKVRHSIDMARLPRAVTKSLREARQYSQQITTVVQECPPGPMRTHLNNLTMKHVQESIQNLDRLEQVLLKLYSHRNIKRELRQVHNEIEKTQKQIQRASMDELKLLRRLVQSKREQLVTLENIQAFQQQTELELRRIASDLNTTHAEMVLVVSKGNFNPKRFNRLDENLKEHLGSLRDMVTVIDELGYNQASVH